MLLINNLGRHIIKKKDTTGLQRQMNTLQTAFLHCFSVSDSLGLLICCKIQLQEITIVDGLLNILLSLCVFFHEGGVGDSHYLAI